MLAIYVETPELQVLCQDFQSVIQDSLDRFDYGRALDLANKWLEQLQFQPPGPSQITGLADQRASIRLWRAELLVQLQRWDQASEELDGLLCRQAQIQNKSMLVRAYMLAAQIHGMYGEQEQAMAALDQSARLDSSGQGESLRQLERARLLVRSGDLEGALQLLSGTLSDEHGIERGRILFRLHRYAEAEDAWLAVAEKERNQVDRFQAEAWRLLGLLHQELGEPQPALEYLERALRSFWLLEMWIGVAKSYEGLGQVCADLGKLAEALHFTDKAERLSRRMGAESELAVVYGRLGNLCMKLGDYSRAIRFHQLDVELCHRFGNFRALAYALFSLALSYRAQGDHQLAYELFSQSLDRFLQLGERGPVLRLRIERGRTLIERNLLEEADQDLQAAGWMLGPATAPTEAAQIYVLSARLERLRSCPSVAREKLAAAFEALENDTKDSSVRCEAWREHAYLALMGGELEAATQGFAIATTLARKAEQQSIWQECLEQLDRLDELSGSEIVLESLHRGNRESTELILNPLAARGE